MTELWYAIIIGAGPAGASAAYFLGQKGLRALVLEREALPRDKPCGGAVPRSALGRFPFSFDPVVEDAVTLVQCAWLDEVSTAELPDTPVVMVRRKEFDTYLLSHAGAEVIDHTGVAEVEPRGDGVRVRSEDGRVWSGRYVLLAEGGKGTLSRSLGFHPRHAGVPTLEAEVPLTQVKDDWRGRALFQFGSLPGGYLWVFPKRDHLSVGIVDFRRAGRPLRGILEREMARLGIRLDGAAARGHPLPIFSGRRPLGLGRILLLGDSAGLVDPLIGEGIRYAMRSGEIAAETIASDGSAEKYTERVAQTLWPSLQRAREIAALCYRFPRLALNVATHDGRGMRWMADVLGGSSDYVRLSHRLPQLALAYLARLRPQRNR